MRLNLAIPASSADDVSANRKTMEHMMNFLHELWRHGFVFHDNLRTAKFYIFNLEFLDLCSTLYLFVGEAVKNSKR